MKLNIPITIVATLFISGGFGYFLYSQNGEDELPPGIAFGNGRIEAVQVDVATRIAGRVDDVLVLEGDLVEKGQQLATINSSQLQAQLLQAEAEVASADSNIAAAQAELAQVNAQLTLAKLDLKRSDLLVKQGTISQEAHDTQVSVQAVAKANVDAAKATVVSKQRARDASQAAVQEIQSQLDDCILVSPAMGRVLYRLAEPGEVLTSGGEVLSLINMGSIYMEIYLPSEQAHRVSIGSEARIKLDMLDTAIPAIVSFVSPESQFTPKQVETASEREKLMFRVKVRVPQELVLEHIDEVKTGVRGVAYVQLTGETLSEWPAFLVPVKPTAPATVAD